MKEKKRFDWIYFLILIAFALVLLPWVEAGFRVYTGRIVDTEQAFAGAKADVKEDVSLLEKLEATASQIELADFVLTRLYFKFRVMSAFAGNAFATAFLSIVPTQVLLILLVTYLLRKIRKLEKAVTELTPSRLQDSINSSNT